jgi:S1-C subfamily serine protease
VVDPASRATLRDVTPASSAARDGFKPGDELVSLEGQPILSIADIQWVLHHAGSAGKLKAEVLRAGKTVPLALTLDAGWRRRDNLSWRATSWDLRRMATGGLLLESLTPDQRKQAGAPAEGLALRVKHVGEYGAHAVAKQAGVRKEDVVVGVDGKTQPMTESELLAYLVSEKKPGDLVPFTVLRSGAKLEMTIRMQ